MPTAPHVTIPNCPECDTWERCVADLQSNTWHCFACGSSGTLDITYRTTQRRAHPSDTPAA